MAKSLSLVYPYGRRGSRRKTWCITSSSGSYGDTFSTKKAARKDLAAEIRYGLKACRRRYKRCSTVGTVREGDVEIRIGGRQGHNMWQRWVITDRCPR